MLELLNQMDGFSSNEKIKVSYRYTPVFFFSFSVLLVLSDLLIHRQVPLLECS
jgi:hypothetical protein